LSESALNDIINLVKIILPSPYLLPKTSKSLIKLLDIETPSKNYLHLHLEDDDKRISIFGYFGKAPINDLLNIPEQIPFDYLHLVLQSHVKWLLRHIFVNYNIFDVKKQGENMFRVNQVIDKIKLPHFFNRKPSNIQNSSYKLILIQICMRINL
jgi:hypothetical protein